MPGDLFIAGGHWTPRGVLLTAFFLLLPGVAVAAKYSLNGYIEAGSRSQAEDFEEEDDDREYTYQKYHLGFSHRVSKLFSYELSPRYYYKNYTSEDSRDNVSRIFVGRGLYYLTRQTKTSAKLDIKIKRKEKRYEDYPPGEYDQIMLAPRLVYGIKNLFSVSVSTGLNDYNYLHSTRNDELRVFAKLGAKGYVRGKALSFAASYKYETAARKNIDRRKNKNDVMLGCDYVFRDVSFIDRVAVRANFGQRDTKDDDDRDEDFDYSYAAFSARTSHTLHPRVHSAVRYEYFTKDYITADRDHKGFSIRGRIKYRILTGREQVFYVIITGKHKETGYPLTRTRDYRKQTLEIKETFRRKERWTVSTTARGTVYDYRDSIRDKNRYYAIISFEKFFPAHKLSLSLTAKYKFTDNKHDNNSEEEAVRFAFRNRF